MTAATDVREVVAQVLDPELPVVTIDELGILRDVELDGDAVTVTITPTYSGCPAMPEIEADIRRALAERGVTDVRVRTVLAPAWTTEWITEEGRRKLRESGIAPPSPLLELRPFVGCPQCGSGDTEELTPFSSTACKALWRCRSCREPFDRFKPL